MNKKQIQYISGGLQSLADAIQSYLKKLGGEPVPFALLVSTYPVMQYVSNSTRQDIANMFVELMAGWAERGNALNIPAHYNEYIKETLDGNEEYLSWFPIAQRRYDPRLQELYSRLLAGEFYNDYDADMLLMGALREAIEGAC